MKNMKKLFISLLSIVLVVIIAVSSVQLIPTLQAVDWKSLKEHFVKEIQNFSLTVEVGEGGTVNDIQSLYPSGTVIDLTATPNEGYIFTGWYTSDDTYLTTSKVYSFAIEKDTVLIANFAPTPENMEATLNYFEELKNCSEDFSFTIQCERPDAESYLASNLTIVDSSIANTDWVEFEKNSFTVERIENTNEYKISLADGTKYDAGTNYIAYLPETVDGSSPEASFVNASNASNYLSFTIKQEETEIVDYNDGIVYLLDSENASEDEVIEIVDDGLIEGDEGDIVDYIVIPKRFGISQNTIFCVYRNEDENGKPILDEQAFFAKADIIEPLSNGNIKVVYILPELEEIYDSLDIYTEGDINLEEQGVEISDEAIEEIKYVLFSNENFQRYIANVYEAGENALAGTGCEIEPIAKKNFTKLFTVKVYPKIKGNTASIKITVSSNIPIKKAGKQVASISFNFEFKKDISVSFGANIKIKYKWKVFPKGVSYYDFWTEISENQSISFVVSAVYNTEANDLKNLEDHINKELKQLKERKGSYIDKVREAFENDGYDLDSNLTVKLFNLSHSVGIVSFNFDVNFFLKFDAGVTLKYTSQSSENTRVGISSASGVYKNVNSTPKTSDLLIAGSFDMRIGLEIDLYIAVPWLEKYINAGIGFEAGGYYTISGCADVNRGYYAAIFEQGVYIKVSAYYRLFSWKGSWTLNEERWSLITYGYDKAIIGYSNQSVNNSTLSLLNAKTKLFDLALLNVTTMDIKNISLSTNKLILNSNQYNINVAVKNGEWLSYNSQTGELIVSPNAPIFFEDQITIKVTPKNNAWDKYFKGKTCVSLPSITLNVTYGNEDAYYDALDNAMQKEFRRIYRNYNENNTKILKDNFKNLIDNAITVSEKYADVFEYISVEYVDQLFDMIKDYRAVEDNKRTMENRFVASEADAFKNFIKYVNDLLDNKTVTKSETHDMLEEILDSVALYDTIIEVSYSDNCTKLAENFTRVDESTKAIVIEALDEFVNTHKNSNDAKRAYELSMALKNMLGLISIEQ